MQTYLEFIDGSSHKFWSIRTENNAFTIVFGKVGTAGQTQKKTFATPDEAEKQAEKQAASKIKKGYAAATPPQSFGAAAKDIGVTAKAAASKTAATAIIPKDLVDDGTQQPWHLEDGGFWEYDWHCSDEEEMAVDVLRSSAGVESVPRPRPTAKEPMGPNPQDTIWYCWDSGRYEDADGNLHDSNNDDDDSDEDADGFDIDMFYRMAVRKPLEKLQTAWAKANAAGVAQERLQLALNQAVSHILSWGLYNNGMKNLSWLLEQGAQIDADDLDKPYATHFYSEYISGSGVVPCDILDRYLDTAYDSMALRLAKGLRQLVEALDVGTIPQGNKKIRRLLEGEELAQCTGFRLRTYEDYYYVYPITKERSPRALYQGEMKETDEVDDDIANRYLPQKLRPLVEKMGNEGMFDSLPFTVFSVRYDTGEVFFEKVLDAERLKKESRAAGELVARLEDTTEWEMEAPNLLDAVHALLYGPLKQDVPRASALNSRFLYCLNDEAEDAADTMLHYHEGTFPLIKYDHGLWLQANGHYHSAYQYMQEAIEMGYAPAEKKAQEYKELARQRAIRIPKTAIAAPPKSTNRDMKRSNFYKVFAQSDLFVETHNIIARADASSVIRIRFKVECEQGFSEALDYLCNLLEKGYARLDSGYTLLVRLLARPQFIKRLSGFAQTTCHAFFAKAVQYPALWEKVQRYAELALVDYDWYGDIDGEENTVTGTFAACALALCDEQFIHMAGKYARHSDNEHQYCQLEVPGALLKAYGPLPEVAKAIFDVACSNGQGGSVGRLAKDLYTNFDNLVAVMEHIENGTAIQHHLDYHVPAYVEAIMTSNIKGNLKKLRDFAKGATGEAQKAYQDFYNLYKNCAAQRDDEDYGEDLELDASPQVADIALPEYDETEPVVLSLGDFQARYPDRKITYTYPAERLTVLFVPNAMDDPTMVEYVFKQWKVLRKIARNAPSSFFWSPCVIGMGDWVINCVQPARQLGAILFDGKKKPFVLYGKLNLVPLFSRFHKRPFKSAVEAEKARLANLLEEAPAFELVPDALAAAAGRYELVASNVLVNRFYAAGVLLATFGPEDGKYYDAALIQRVILAGKMAEPDQQKAIYEELFQRQPQHAAYWQEKLDGYK